MHRFSVLNSITQSELVELSTCLLSVIGDVLYSLPYTDAWWFFFASASHLKAFIITQSIETMG